MREATVEGDVITAAHWCDYWPEEWRHNCYVTREWEWEVGGKTYLVRLNNCGFRSTPIVDAADAVSTALKVTVIRDRHDYARELWSYLRLSGKGFNDRPCAFSYSYGSCYVLEDVVAFAGKCLGKCEGCGRRATYKNVERDMRRARSDTTTWRLVRDELLCCSDECEKHFKDERIRQWQLQEKRKRRLAEKRRLEMAQVAGCREQVKALKSYLRKPNPEVLYSLPPELRPAINSRA